MHEYEHELWPHGDMCVLVLIQYVYDRSENDGGYITSGSIQIENVIVDVVTGFDGPEVVYSKDRLDIDPDWFVVLEDYAYTAVQEAIDDWGSLADELVGCAS